MPSISFRRCHATFGKRELKKLQNIWFFNAYFKHALAMCVMYLGARVHMCVCVCVGGGVYKCYLVEYSSRIIQHNTTEPRYNEVLGTIKITFLYQVSHYIRVKKQRNIKRLDQQNDLVIRGYCYIWPLYNEVPLYMVLFHQICGATGNKIKICSVGHIEEWERTKCLT